ncbi:MAG TPA: hypothetical protein VFH78_12375 [Candidatus Thermoplasmatota archaeon]|nr:hypothetical protein [Candidatus Thermoplasmatota archaeon]
MERKPLVLGAAVAALLVGAAVAYFVLAEPGGAGRPSPPCPEPYFAGPDGLECYSTTEVCNAHYTGAVRERVSCTVESLDGRGKLLLIFQGPGRADISVSAGGRTLYERSLTASTAQDVDAVSGARGTWTLTTSFDTRGGAGRIVLYG